MEYSIFSGVGGFEKVIFHREGFKNFFKKIMENSIMGLDPPPLFMKKNKVFFFETRPFFSTF